MAALAAGYSRPFRDAQVIVRPVQRNQRIFQGSLVEIDGDGRVRGATKADNVRYVGVAEHDADNRGGAAGAISVSIRRGIAAHFKTIGTAEIGKDGFAEDDNTVSDSDNGRSLVGRIIDSDSDGVWVLLQGETH